MHMFHGLFGLPGGGFKLCVSGFQLFQTLDIGGQLVGSLNDKVNVLFRFLQQGSVTVLQLCRQLPT